MKAVFSVVFAVLFGLTAATALSAETQPGEAAIRTLLSRQKNWILYSEYTDAAVPSDRAQQLRFEYYPRDTRLMGRWLLAYGGCEFELALRADGFSFPWCPPYNGVPTLNYDPQDARYPFKDLDHPRKLWLQAVE